MAEPKPKAAGSIDTEMVKHVASLVRLGLDEDEARRFSGQFAEILDYFRLLNAVDTEDVPPASEQPAVRNVTRPDEVRPSLPRDEFLSNVPHAEGPFVRVPNVFDEE